ncbi:hypothetical protein DFH29DRAFT_1008871 [Suillus ampliporus]|nr:hypothetical protein DFH29DRAFT_1008871 [Suillus ampliporus]
MTTLTGFEPLTMYTNGSMAAFQFRISSISPTSPQLSLPCHILPLSSNQIQFQSRSHSGMPPGSSNTPPRALPRSAWPWTKTKSLEPRPSDEPLSDTWCGKLRFVFPFINICTTSNTCPALPEYLNDIVTMFTHWQVGILDDDGLFQSFHTHNFNVAGDLMARYRIINNYSYSWWKDQFDLLPFEMPNRIPLDKVIQLYREHEQQVLALTIQQPAGYLLLPDLCRHEVGPDPLLTNLRVIKDDL